VIVLGFDTATQASAVGLRLPDGRTLHARDDPAQGQHPGHATRLLAMAAELLAQADLRWGELERIAVGVGPGRFTGLRVGIATARGLAQSLGAQLVGVSSLRALGLAAIDARAGRKSHGEPATGTIAVIDARRGEAFVAAYPPENPEAAAQPAEEIVFSSALRPPEMSGLVAQIEARGGPRGQRWTAVGDGALLYEQALADGGIDVAPSDSPLHLIDGAAICELGAQAQSATDGSLAAVLPDYRRSPDAALARPWAGSTPAATPAAGATPGPAAAAISPAAAGGDRR
jgi:tRNA threonylcarbamoyladenosine biosynthesis protein TsaB